MQRCTVRCPIDDLHGWYIDLEMVPAVDHMMIASEVDHIGMPVCVGVLVGNYRSHQVAAHHNTLDHDRHKGHHDLEDTHSSWVDLSWVGYHIQDQEDTDNLLRDILGLAARGCMPCYNLDRPA